MIKSIYPLAHNTLPTQDIKAKKKALDTTRQNQLLSLVLADNKESKNRLISAITELKNDKQTILETEFAVL